MEPARVSRDGLTGKAYNSQVQPNWFVAKTKLHSEDLARKSFEQYGILNYLPTLLIAGSGKKQLLKSVPLFPTYLFFQLDLTSKYWPYIRWAPGVAYVLHDEQGPTPIPVELVNDLKGREMEQHSHKRRQLVEPFKPQEQLQVSAGPFAGLEAVFEKPLSSTGRVQVLVEILGQITRINLERNALLRLRV